MKPHEKQPWRGPSHHKNKPQAKPAKHHIQKKPKPITKQLRGTFRREQPVDYFLVLDFECTCEMEDRTWPHEIIEFPVVLMNAATGEIVAEFHRYVRPILRPTLTPFCKNLTGIQQATVDAAEPLPVVVRDFERWLEATVPQEGVVCAATDGPTDLELFMYRMAVKRDGVSFPKALYTYVDVKLTFTKFFKTRSKLKLPTMLHELGLKMEGQHHSGIDDTRNIARLMNAMMDKGCVFQHPIRILHHGPSPQDSPEVRSAEEVDTDSGASQEVSDDDDDTETATSPTGSNEPPTLSAANPSSSCTEAGPSGPCSKRRLVFHNRNLDREATDNPVALRRRKIMAALASPEEMLSLRLLAKTAAKGDGKIVPAREFSRSTWILSAFAIASLINLLIAYVFM